MNNSIVNYILRHKLLYLLFLPCVVYLFIFCYIPMYGVVLAFKDYHMLKGILASPWSGLDNFKELFSDPYFVKVTVNTLKISILNIICGFPIPAILALLLNEIRREKFKRTIQTLIFLPHFLSWVILAGILLTFLKTDEGLINQLFMSIGLQPIPFLSDGRYFVPMLIATSIWKEAGWGTIIYLAALSGIDPEQYEAAVIDGASRWQRFLYITLPGLMVAVSINLIFSVSGILNANFDQIFNLYSPLVYDVADVIDTYLYRTGLLQGEYSLGTALGLFKSGIGLLLIILVNKIIKRMGGEGIW